MYKRILPVLIILLCSCSSLKTEQELLSQSYKRSDFEESKAILNSKEFQKEQNRLLRLMELSTVSYRELKYFEALKVLEDAQNLADKLYTKSIKSLILSGFLGREAKEFYGKIFERSYLYHLQAKIFFKLYSGQKFLKLEGNSQNKNFIETKIPKEERRKYLLQARSIVLKWNSFYEGLKRSAPNNYFSYDYYQQLIAALIHEEVGTRKERNIALILYENTLKDFEKLIALYPSFNLNYESTLEGYLNRKGKSLVTLTPKGIKLKDFITFKVLNLTKKIKKNKYQKRLKELSPSDDVLLKLEKDQKNITIISSFGLIDPMKEKIVSYNLNWILDKIEDQNLRTVVEVIGISTLTYFTLGTLGLSTYSYTRHGERGRYIYRDVHVGNSLIKNIGIDIKIPYQNDDFRYDQVRLVSTQRELGTFSTLNSNVERSYISTKQYANKYYGTFGPKMALKYLGAIVAAYSSYKALKKADNPFASTLALAQYLVSTKAIVATQKVDLRSWVGLSRINQFLNISRSEAQQEGLSLNVNGESKQLLDGISTNSLFFL